MDNLLEFICSTLQGFSIPIRLLGVLDYLGEQQKNSLNFPIRSLEEMIEW
jgi:hypothetical protein